MNDYFLTFRSVTTAMRAGTLLRGAGIFNATVRTPLALRQQGCGYSLRVSERSYAAAAALLRQNELPFRKLYRKLADGQWQEVGE